MVSCSEDVCIVLNEQESRKAELAERLSQRLMSLGLCAVRIPPRQGLAQIIQVRAPKVLITDYVLSGYGTGLDLLSEAGSASRKFLFWTDEPSVRAAVAAMKLGAEDYFQIDSPASLERVAEAARRLNAQYPAARLEPSPPPLAASSPAFQRTLIHAQAVLNSSRKLVLTGEQGSGRSTVAAYIHRRLPSSGVYHEHSCLLFPEIEPAEFQQYGPEVTVTVEHAEELRCPREAFKALSGLRARLIIATMRFAAAEAAREFFRCENVTVPPLRERPEDILPLLRRSAALVSRQLAAAPLSQDLVGRLRSLDWPGNVREFSSCTLAAFAAQAAERKKGFSEEKFAAALEEAKARWESGKRTGRQDLE